jgi:hypothetical protein
MNLGVMLIKQSVYLPITKAHDPSHNPNLTIFDLIFIALCLNSVVYSQFIEESLPILI